VRLYIDVETYRRRDEDAFVNEKVIAIGVLEDKTRYTPESSSIWNEGNVAFKFFTEWEYNDERELILAFYEYLRGLVKQRREKKISFLNVVGFNILRFDIPLLVEKGFEHGAGSIAELNKLWHDTHTIDYLQASLPLNEMRFKDLSLRNLAERARRAGVEVPEAYGTGGDVKKWYENREYDKIIKHLKADLKITRIVDLNYKRVLNMAPNLGNNTED